jgi:hypothetical protein
MAEGSVKPNARPRTIREIKADKERKQEEDKGTITVTNTSGQMLPIHLNAPKGVDFFFGAQDIRLKRGQTYAFKKNRVRMDQLMRLQKMGKLQVIGQTESQDEMKKVVKITK